MSPLIKKSLQTILTYFGYIYCLKIKSTSNAVYITFDDGPNVKFTLPVLAVLEKHQAKATFFLQGNSIKGSEIIVNQILESGHGIGNHSYAHKNFTKCNYREMMEDIERADIILKQYLPGKKALIRPPYGKFRLKYIVYAFWKGRKTILWSKDCKDYDANSVREVLGKVDYSDVLPGDIMLMHDQSQICVDALDIILQELKGRGYVFYPLPGSFR